jgi:uncharacterized protein (DUF362 family)
VRRRTFVVTAAEAVGAVAVGCRDRQPTPKWSRTAFTRPDLSPVAVLRAESYGGPLDELITRGLSECGLDPSGRRVLLKPNFVEYDPHGVINTHPAVVQAAIVALRRLGAAEVTVAEGPGHRRDLEYLLDATGIRDVLRDTGVRFADLNLSPVRSFAPRASFSRLGTLYLPETLLATDLLVSMPKMKTHHWAGVTLSLKNMFGVMPGAIYGWPKNVLHWAGIPQSILDINAGLTRIDRFNIVDGIVGMEGNGPIQGTPRPTGVLVLGADPVAVDATCCRIMEVDPSQVGYLREAGAFLGNAETTRIEQRGEKPPTVSVAYDLTPRFAPLRRASAANGASGTEAPAAQGAGS